MTVFRIVTVGLLVATASPAASATLQYTLTGTDIYGEAEYASFQIDDHPTILSNNFELGYGFRVKNLTGTFQYGDGSMYFSNLQDVEFIAEQSTDPDQPSGGFVTLYPTDKTGEMGTILFVVGPQLYTGPESAPTLLTGQFTVVDGFSPSPLSLNVSAVPEATSWMMMILGIGAIGFGLRSRRTANVRVRYA